jgi:hypothetical protein
MRIGLNAKENVMTKRVLVILLLALLVIVSLSGCAASTANLISAGFYEKQTIPDKKTYFSRIWAVEDDGGLRVSGYLQLKGAIGVDIPEYVEVALVKPDGDLLEAKKIAYFPRSLYNRPGHREGRFRTTFTQVPPQGTTIRLSNVN